MSDNQSAYESLVDELRDISLLGSVQSVLGWDEQTNLPPAGSEHRANQLALLAGMRHERMTSAKLGELITAAEQSVTEDPVDSPTRVNVREARRDYDRATKLPRSLVEELSRTTTLSQSAWVKARQEDDYGQFQSWLDQIVTLKRQEAECLGISNGTPYDALLDDYEPGATTEQVQSVFTPLREELVELVQAIRDSGRQPHIEILTRTYPIEQQADLGRSAAAMIGFDFEAGRLDIAAHPFCSGFGPGDCRLTTRYDEHHFPGAFFGTLHEAGHGIYEQGLSAQAYGTAMGDSCSLGIHESQSRLWENFVGRSRSFWEYFYPQTQQTFPAALQDVSLDEFHFAINDVRPSHIRVEADEVTYNLHIMLRFELEQALIAGDLGAADIPTVWNETFASYFGLTVPSDALGCLQDIHWSAGFIGYFPTYALGNMYAAQLATAAETELGSLDELYRKGEFQPLKEWLNREIHERGKQYRAPELIARVAGQGLDHRPLVKHLNAKFRPLYGI